jgi:hypothetical protein
LAVLARADLLANLERKNVGVLVEIESWGCRARALATQGSPILLVS